MLDPAVLGPVLECGLEYGGLDTPPLPVIALPNLILATLCTVCHGTSAKPDIDVPLPFTLHDFTLGSISAPLYMRPSAYPSLSEQNYM